MVRRACDGPGLLGAFRAAVASLEASVDEINALNVFPVPDGDTGTNMVATVRAALAEAEAVGPSGTAERVAAAAAFGALMGARGNSGVITSQVLRGIAEGLAGKTRFNALDLANALDAGTRAAYGAVAKPVEGTILTVIREASAAAVASAERERDLEVVLTATLQAAEKAVAKTPSLLAILREAGVVDSGGQGLYRLLQGAHAYLTGGAASAALATSASRAGAAKPGVLVAGPRGAGSPASTGPAVGSPAAGPSVLVAHGDDGFGYETMFLAQARPGERLDPDAIRAHLEALGESVLVAGDARAVKVHIHNEHPDQVIGYGLTIGALSRISVENLDQQAQDVRESRAAAFTEAPAQTATETPASDVAHDGGNGTGLAQPDGPEPGDGVGPGDTASEDAEPIPLAVIAVAAGEGLAAIFRDFGVSRVVAGGQSANPSTGELLEAVRSVNAREVVVLPNNPNVVLAARQVAQVADRPVSVVATRNAAEGFAALLALDPTKGAAENATEMTTAGRAIQTLSATVAVRDARIGGRKVKKGQAIVLDPDDGLVAAADDMTEAVLAAVAKLAPGFELVTMYYGADADLAGAELLARQIGERVRGAEVEVVHGGQPYYHYLISAE
ncbi:MAG TPA: DAK2 domain-containing protein [Candidatus Eisenbacteria bacterium]|nr:DAK2 domain-containing protein [Candidatus Eisenbacteria bacterium]